MPEATLGRQQCSNCAKTFPACGKKKRVHRGFCRPAYWLAINENQEKQGETKQ